MNVACLVGNGSSVVYNDQLAIEPLTGEIVAAFSQLSGTQAKDALAAFASQVTGNDRSDFEGLLGPIDTITQALPLLGGAAAPFANVDWIAEPLDAASNALRDLHRLGLATALRSIATHAHGQGQDALDSSPGTLVQALLEAVGDDRLTIATLNYDGLLQAALRDATVADLARGWGEELVELSPGIEIVGWPIRTTDDLPDGRQIHLLHLHGSLGWLRSADGITRKYKIDHLREHDIWATISEGTVDVEPVVVLTDRKDDVVATEPFSLGYQVFRHRLQATSHWCVAGYSFLDSPVNRSFADVVSVRRALGLADPKMLVLGYGDAVAIESTIRETLGELTPELFIDGTGLPDSVSGDPWQEWLP